MPEPRSPAHKPRRAGTSSGRVLTTGLTSEEEKLLRMRHGLALGPTARVGRVDPALPVALQAELRAIELRALQESGRLDTLDDAAALELGERSQEQTKAKIIQRLGRGR